MGSAQQEVGYSGLFKNHNALEFEYSSQDSFNTHEHQTRWTWSQDIGDAKLRRDFWYLKRFARGEAMNLWRELRDRKCLIKSTYIVWFDHNSVVCSVYEADRIDVTIMRQSYSATNWQQEVCDFQNAWIHHLTFTQFASNFIRIL